MSNILKKNKLASEILKEVANVDNHEEKVTLFEIKSALHEKGFNVLIIIFSLPLSVPIPVPPGYTTILSIPLILFSLQLLLSYKFPWMPRWLERKSFKRSTLSLIVQKTSPTLEKIEKMIKPRMHFVCYGPGKKILAFIMFLCSMSIAIPLPLTNFIPAIGITLISLGTMNNDGLLSLLGVAVSVFGLLLTAVIMIIGPKLILEVFYFLKGFL
ncbi:MAG: exopolysaccharide biosynthesis protein [Wolbachia endosymbiont of Fragariocoptes setiger]|nr:exopolysaccharide biosynthesis protein [Wolbachia endosymbiont of Fragariocoptes setiger]